MTTSKSDASKAGHLMHSKSVQVRSVAASDLAQARRDPPKPPSKPSGGKGKGK